MEEIDIKDFLDYLKKYSILIIVISVILMSLVFIYDKSIKKPMYTTYTTIVLVKGDNSSVTGNSEAISQSDILLNQNLVSTYSQIINSKLVLKQVIKNLNLDYTVKGLSRNIKVEALQDTEILKISVSDLKPDNAADIANEIAKVFSLEIKKIYKINNVSVIDDAAISYDVSNNTIKRDLALALMVSIFGTSAIIFIKFYFDDTIKYSENLEQEIGMPVIAKVLKDDEGTDLITQTKPNSLTSESIRNLRTNLQFSAVDDDVRTILVTSTLPSEGKSFISANLAISFAQAGKRVLLVDCDLRKGRQHRIFHVNNKIGLSNLLVGNSGKTKDYIKKTSIDNLYLVTRGICPPNPTELLSSKKNSAFINKMSEWYDVVIFDGVPCNGLSDSLIISSLVDRVVIVSSENYTPKTDLLNTKKAIENSHGIIAGIVINNINMKSGGNKYYYYYEDEDR